LTHSQASLRDVLISGISGRLYPIIELIEGAGGVEEAASGGAHDRGSLHRGAERLGVVTLGALHIYPRISGGGAVSLDHHRRGRGELSGGRLSGLSGEPLSAERLKHLHHQPALSGEQRDALRVAQSIAGEVIAGEGAGGDGERPHGRQALSALNALKVADQTHAGAISEALEQLKGEGGGELRAGAGGGRDADNHLSGELDGEHGRVREGAGGEIEGGGGHRVQVDTEGRGEQGAGLDGGELSEGISGGGDIEGGADTLSASEGLSGGRLDHLSGRLSDDLADARGRLIIEGEPLTDLISGEGEAPLISRLRVLMSLGKAAASPVRVPQARAEVRVRERLSASRRAL
jgi:hypothetical protein